jgi:murein DD-endopeptidase MepM/ murein hydrolase activator NlpD
MNDLEQLLARDPPGIGDNFPPPESLAEHLAEETAALRARADELVLNLKERAVVATEDDAEKMTLLLAMVAEHSDVIEACRVERKAPYLADARIVDEHFGDLQFPLVGNPRKKGGAYAEGHARLDAYRRRQEAAALAERRRLEDEARKQREAAEAAERARLRAEQAQRDATDKAAAEKARREKAEAELAARKAADAAAQFDARAEAAEAPQVIHSGYGPRAARRVTHKVVIVDLSKALRHALRIDAHRVRECVQAIFEAQVRGGVRELPGADIVTDSTTVIRK